MIPVPPPPTQQTTAGGDLLRQTVGVFERRIRARELLGQLLWALAAIGAFPLLVVALDHMLTTGLPRLLILGMGAFWALCAVTILLVLLLRTLLRRPSALYVARYAERARGIAHNFLVNTLLIERGPAGRYAAVTAHRQTVDALLAKPGNAPQSPPHDRTGLWLVALMAGLWVCYAAITPKPVFPSLARFLGADRAAPTATRLLLVHPAAGEAVYAGEPLLIEVAARGRAVDTVTFERLPVAPGSPAADDAQPIYAYPLNADPAAREHDIRRVTLAAHETARRLYYRIRGGDAVLAGTIELRPLPSVVDLRVDLEPPAYVGEPPRTVRSGEVRAWEGSRAAFTATASTAIRDPILVLRSASGETRTRMIVAVEDECIAAVRVPLRESGEFWVEFADPWGKRAHNVTRRKLVVRSDSPPRIRITAPLRDADIGHEDEVDITSVARIEAVAADDIRLVEIAFVTDRDGELQRRRMPAGGGSVAHRQIEVAVPTADLGLAVGQSLRCWFEARDGRTTPDGKPAYQTSTTRVLTLIRSFDPADMPTPEGVPTAVDDETGSGDEGPGDGEETRTGERRERRPRQPSDPQGESSDQAGSASGESPSDGGGESSEDDDSIYVPVDDPDAEPEGAVEGRPESGSGSDRAAGEDGDDPESSFERRLREFVEQHGDDAAEVTARSSEPRERQDDSEDSADPDAPETRQSDQGGGNRGESAEQPPTDSEPQAEQTPEDAERVPDQAEESTDQSERQAETPQEPSAESTLDDEESKSEEVAPADGSSQERADPPPADSGEAESSERETPSKDPAEETGGSQAGEGPQAGDDAESADREPPAQDDDPADGIEETGGGEQPDGADTTREGGPEDSAAGEQDGPGIDEPELDDAQPSSEGDAPSEDLGDDTGGLAEVQAVLDLLERFDEIGEEQLAEIGWSAARRREFVTAFQRLRSAAQRAGVIADIQRWRWKMDLGSAERQIGRGLATGVGRDVAEGLSGDDGMPAITAPREQAIPPALEAVLEAYYRSLAERRARTQSDRPEKEDSP